jgi:hypothetical protein
MEAIQTSTIVGDRSICNAIKQMNIITILMIHSMSSNQSTLNNNIGTEIPTVAPNVIHTPWSQLGMILEAHIRLIMAATVVTITVVLGD